MTMLDLTFCSTYAIMLFIIQKWTDLLQQTLQMHLLGGHMPDVQVRFRESVIADEFRTNFFNELAPIVAANMDCPVKGVLTPLDSTEEIDIFPMPFDVTSGRTVADILIYISAFDYKARMANIKDRLEAIKLAVEQYFEESTVPTPKVYVSFNPMKKKCWVA
jgi:hypothetical protein